jgi:hypothetical protein
VYRQIPVLDESPSPLLVFSIAATRWGKTYFAAIG